MVELKNVSMKFNEFQAITDISFSVKPNEIVCILGPSGCGKTTILNLISGILSPSKGQVQVNVNKIAYVFQEDRLIEGCTVFENIHLVSKETDKREAYKWIKKVGLEAFSDAYPRQLSGGMRQRCAMARAFFYNAPLLLMDEPFKSLDFNLRLEMVENLIDLWKKSRNSVIFVTHEIDEALMLGHKIIILSKNPAYVLDVLDLKKPQELRTLGDPELIDARNRIVQYMLKK